MDSKDKSSVYLSVFKRKGGEGYYTKIVNDENKSQYSDILSKLVENENPLIIYYKNILNCFLLTNYRILFFYQGQYKVFNNIDIIEVRPAIEEELKDRISDKKKFTRLKLKTKDNEEVIISLEVGNPYEGIYQVLHFIKTNNLECR